MWMRFFLPAVLLLAACAAPREGAEDTWGARVSDSLAPVIPEALRPGGKGGLQPALRVEPEAFKASERREVRVFLTVKNTAKKAERLEFPTAQRFDLAVLAPDGKRIFKWSEDRAFESASASVVVNPRERIEYEAAVPTRDMKSGQVYRVEAGLSGYPEVTASTTLQPQ